MSGTSTGQKREYKESEADPNNEHYNFDFQKGGTRRKVDDRLQGKGCRRIKTSKIRSVG